MTGYDFYQNFCGVIPLVMIVFCLFMKKRYDVKTITKNMKELKQP
jgi:hypothetical protein